MLVLIWVTLLFTVRGSTADKGASVGKGERCQESFCNTVNEAEITAEAGLCAIIPCSFTTETRLTPQYMVWFKCESQKNCGHSNMIFYKNKNNKRVNSGFRGRVSLLEPDVKQRNCSIIINDLTESDSGSYKFRVYGSGNGFIFRPRAYVSVKGLTQKPTVMIPPLTAGQQTTLTCTAPGLCSGSDPKITWTWRGAGEKDSHITGNITAFKTEILTAVTQRHSSILVFNVSATQHHGTKVTCKVSFSNNITTEETVTLSVTYPAQQRGSWIAVLPWVVAAVSLIVSVICIIYVLFLWNTRKKMKPNQEDRTYMSLRKRESSPDYEDISQIPHCD